MKTRVVELDARVVQVARAQFCLPADDARLSVEIGDGAEALAPACCDLLVVDAFADELERVDFAVMEAFRHRVDEVVTVDVSEFEKADGGLTCLSLRTNDG